MPISAKFFRQRRLRLPARGLILGGLVALLGGSRLAAAEPGLLGRPQQESPVLARVGEELITLADFEAALRQRGAARYNSVEARRALLDELVRFRALVARARALGYDRDPEVVALLERTLVAKVQRELFAEIETYTPDAAEIEAFYRANPKEFTQPARAELALVLIALPTEADPARREAGRQRAEEALAAARALPAGQLHLGAVAAQYSDHRESRAFGGRVGWIEEGALTRWPAALVTELFARPAGELFLLEQPEGFYLARGIRKENARLLPLASLQDGLRARLEREAREAARARVEEQALVGIPIEIDEQVLAALPPSPSRPISPPEPPPLPAFPAGPSVHRGEGSQP